MPWRKIPQRMPKASQRSCFERADVTDTPYKDGKTAEKLYSDLPKLKDLDKPFFLAAGFLKPHLPFNAPVKYWKLYDGKVQLPNNNFIPENAPAESMHTFGELRAYADIPAKGPVSDEMAYDLIQGYYACVSYTDAQVGKVLDALEELELEQSTIVILWGDHGWNLREHGLWCKHCNYETSLHTPLILKVPGTKQVASTSQIVEYVDIYPTLCELSGLSLPAHLEGASFTELLFDEGKPGQTEWQSASGLRELPPSATIVSIQSGLMTRTRCLPGCFMITRWIRTRM